ncbi:hypothetical protein [Calidifontibacillus erzurumensis]|uniref:Spore coat protein B n=1 Tax=Calidifontibacillus erzurumensis TaxID=2741433 RepID=A0A8J8K830_9BACI|nr:hypothetical protein [Calidifontibacillus erzurumensis]NSL51441.1 hypothetical protein [Calidifontibacillus erzurumensis]
MEIDNSFLSTMIGKEVKSFKDGPESWHGVLLAVHDDYIKLFNKKDGFIYYKTKHIKNVVADSKPVMIEDIPDVDDNEDRFHKLLENLEDHEVKINLGGPESRKGLLLGVTDEYLVLYHDKEGVIYYNLEHVKGVSVKYKPKAKEDEEHEGEENDNTTEIAQPTFIEVNSLHRLFKKLKYNFVMINRGPDAVEGVLVDVKDQLLTLVFRDEVLRVNQFHVKSVRQKTKSQNNENNQKNDESILLAKKKIQDRKKRR